jgi:hypothetical protein
MADADFTDLRAHFARAHIKQKPVPVVDFYSVLAWILMELTFTVEAVEPFEAAEDTPPSKSPTRRRRGRSKGTGGGGRPAST